MGFDEIFVDGYAGNFCRNEGGKYFGSSDVCLWLICWSEFARADSYLVDSSHGNEDAGDFVLDALGQRWAGELGNFPALLINKHTANNSLTKGDGNYLAAGYFSSEAQDSERWTYYRDRTEGQNTLLLDSVSQNVLAAPTTDFGTTGESQDSLDYTPVNSSTAFFRMDFSTTYNNT